MVGTGAVVGTANWKRCNKNYNMLQCLLVFQLSLKQWRILCSPSQRNFQSSLITTTKVAVRMGEVFCCFKITTVIMSRMLKYSSYYHTIIIFIFSVEGWNFNLVLTCGWNRCCRWHCKLKRCNLKIQGEFSNHDRNSGFLICSTSHRIPTLVSNSKKLSG